MFFIIFFLPERWKATKKGHKNHERNTQDAEGESGDYTHAAFARYRVRLTKPHVPKKVIRCSICLVQDTLQETTCEEQGGKGTAPLLSTSFFFSSRCRERRGLEARVSRKQRVSQVRRNR